MSSGQIMLEQHRRELEHNRRVWESKPLLREIYAGFYNRMIEQIDPTVPGRIVEIGSGLGALKDHFPAALRSDLFPYPWLDVVCDAYELPFQAGTVSHLLLFDVFHHLAAPGCFLQQARRVLARRGRIILLEPYVSWASGPVYGWIHHEGLNWTAPINREETLARPRDYYTGQGNATRLFFRQECPALLEGWAIVKAEAFASFSYLLSGGFRARQLYPEFWLGAWERIDRWLSKAPELFGARCLVVLGPK